MTFRSNMKQGEIPLPFVVSLHFCFAFLKQTNLEIHKSKFVEAFTEVFAKNKLFAPVNITLSESPCLQNLNN